MRELDFFESKASMFEFWSRANPGSGTFDWVMYTASARFLAATMIQGMFVLSYDGYSYQIWNGAFIYWDFLVVTIHFD